MYRLSWVRQFALIMVIALVAASVSAEVLFVYQMDQTPIEGSYEIVDRTSQTEGTIGCRTSETMPTLAGGANSYTGQAWDFSTTDKAIMVENNVTTQKLGDVDNSDGMSVAFWFKLDNSSNVYANSRVTGFSSSSNIWEFNVSGRDLNITIGSAPTVSTSGSDVHPLDGSWHHVAVTADFNSTINNLKFYIDGQYKSLLTQSYNFSSSFFGSGDVIIGARGNCGNDFKGMLDDFLAADHALSASEVATIANYEAFMIAPKCAGPADINSSCVVDMADIAKLAEGWLDAYSLTDLNTIAADWLKIQNFEPYAYAGANKVLMIESGQASVTYDLDATATDSTLPAGVLSKSWIVAKKPAGSTVTFGNANATDTTVSFNAEGEYVLHFIADDSLLSAYDSLTFHVFDEVASGFAADRFTPPGPAYEHPRILFSKSDIPAMLDRLANTESGQGAWKTLEATSTFMRHGQAGYDFEADYSVQLDGGIRYLNVGQWIEDYNLYQQLIAGNTSALSGDWLRDMGPASRVAEHIADEALYCLLTDDAVYAADVAAAITTWANAIAPTITPGDEWFGDGRIFDKAGRDYIGFAYDFIYDYMTVAQRDTVRAFIAKATAGQIPFGYAHPDESRSGNWIPFHNIPLTHLALAIEGETGYDPEVYRMNVELFTDFYSYQGHENGGQQEELGKGATGVRHVIAMAKRGDMLIGHEHFRAYLRKFLYNITQPYGYGFIAMGDLGTHYRTYGSQRLETMIAKYAFPNDELIDIMYSNHGSQVYSDDLNDAIYKIVACTDFLGGWESGWQWKQDEPLAFYEPERGAVISRSDWSTDALYMYFTCRQDMLDAGHNGSQRNSFHLSALGRNWTVYTDRFNHGQSMVFIDGNGSHRAYGEILDFDDTPEATFTTGDATYSYNWSWERTGGLFEPLTWNDMAKEPGHEYWMDTPLSELFSFFSPTRVTKVPMNNIEYAYRTAGLVRGDRPYVLIVDDIKKDSSAHLFEWRMRIDNDLLDGAVINGNDITLSDPTTDRRLLVRFVDCAATPAISVSEITYSEDGPAAVIRATATAVTPDFKVVIYPYHEGDSLPVTDIAGDVMTITIDGQQDVYTMTDSADGRTLLSRTRSIPQPWVNVYAGADIDVTAGRDSVPLAWVDGDDFSGAISVEWDVVDKPSGAAVTFNPSRFVIDPEITCSDPNDYVLSVTATKGALTDYDEVNVHALPVPPEPLMLFEMDEEIGQNDSVTDAAGNVSATMMYGDPNETTPASAATGTGSWYLGPYGGNNAQIHVAPDAYTQQIGNTSTATGLTMAMWLKHDDFKQENSYERVAGFAPGIDVYFYKNAARPYARLNFNVGGSTISVGSESELLPENVADGGWNHVVYTADFTSTTDNIKVYVNGVLYAMGSYTFSDFSSTTDTFKIGARLNNGNQWSGYMDDCIVFDMPISGGDVIVGQAASGYVQMLYQQGGAVFLP